MTKPTSDQNVPLAAAALLAETCLLMVIATAAKVFASSVSVEVFPLFRYVFALPLLFAMSMWQFGTASFRVTDLSALALRSVFGLIGLTSWIFAVSMIEITLATAITQSMPVFITLFAPLILGERVGLRRWTAVMFGLAGTMVLIRPGMQGWLQPGIGFALASPIFGALMLVYLRKLGTSDNPVKTSMLYNMFGATVFMVWCLIGDFDWPETTAELLALAGCGTVASIQQWLLALSHKHASASTLAPIHYLSVPISIAVGILLFGESLTVWFIAGTSIIVFATYYIIIRERKIGRRRLDR